MAEARAYAEPDAERPEVVLVSAMRNEGPFILEWLAYHRVIGIGRIVVISNGPRTIGVAEPGASSTTCVAGPDFAGGTTRAVAGALTEVAPGCDLHATRRTSSHFILVDLDR